MRGCIIVMLLVVPVNRALTQWDARSIGQADMAGVAGDEYWVGHGNPAVLGNIMLSSFSISVIPSPFGLPELRRVGALFGTTLYDCGVGIEVKAYGGSLFRRYDLSTGVGLRLERGTSVGLQASVRRWSFATYSGISDGSVTAGFVQREPGWTLGASAAFHAEAGSERSAAADVTAGVRIEPFDALDISWEVEQQHGYEMILRCGMFYMLSDRVSLYGGWSDVESILSFGGTFSIGAYACSIGSQHHDVLGWTHALGLTFRLGNSEEMHKTRRD